MRTDSIRTPPRGHDTADLDNMKTLPATRLHVIPFLTAKARSSAYGVHVTIGKIGIWLRLVTELALSSERSKSAEMWLLWLLLSMFAKHIFERFFYLLRHSV
jgi:hypothetical protein